MILYYFIFYVIQVIHCIALSRELEHIEKSFENLIFKKKYLFMDDFNEKLREGKSRVLLKYVLQKLTPG